MIEFPTHKIILEMGENRENCLLKTEISFDSQIDLPNFLNQVIRPILISMGYLNCTISEAFNMNECGEEYKETLDFEDGALDIEPKKDLMYDTDDI